MKLFVDRCISVHIARMLAHFDRVHNIVHQDDDGRFQPDSPDVEIIEMLAGELSKPIWITADISQKKIPSERAALRDSGMTVFFSKRNQLTPHHQSLKWLAIWPTLIEFAENTRIPTAFEIPFGRIGGKLNTKIDTLGKTSELFR